MANFNFLTKSCSIRKGIVVLLGRGGAGGGEEMDSLGGLLDPRGREVAIYFFFLKGD